MDWSEVAEVEELTNTKLTVLCAYGLGHVPPEDIRLLIYKSHMTILMLNHASFIITLHLLYFILLRSDCIPPLHVSAHCNFIKFFTDASGAYNEGGGQGGGGGGGLLLPIHTDSTYRTRPWCGC